MSDSIHLYQSVTLFPSSQYFHLPDTPNILFTAIQQHNIRHIHCTGYTALLETHHNYFWWDALPFLYDLHLLSNTFIFLVLYTFLNPWRFMVFSTDGVSVVENFKYMCSEFLCGVCGLISLSSWLFFMVLNVWIGWGFFFKSCSSFLIFQLPFSWYYHWTRSVVRYVL